MARGTETRHGGARSCGFRQRQLVALNGAQHGGSCIGDGARQRPARWPRCTAPAAARAGSTRWRRAAATMATSLSCRARVWARAGRVRSTAGRVCACVWCARACPCTSAACVRPAGEIGGSVELVLGGLARHERVRACHRSGRSGPDQALGVDWGVGYVPWRASGYKNPRMRCNRCGSSSCLRKSAVVTAGDVSASGREAAVCVAGDEEGCSPRRQGADVLYVRIGGTVMA